MLIKHNYIVQDTREDKLLVPGTQKLYDFSLLLKECMSFSLCKSAGRVSHSLFSLYFVLLVKSFLSITLFALLRVIFVLFIHLFSAMELWENITFAMFLLRRSLRSSIP